MATGGISFPIWDRRNSKEQKLVDGTSYSKRLRKGGVVLRRNLQTDEVLPQLLQLDVLDRLKIEEITYNCPRAVIVDRLVAFIQTCVMWQFHGLLRSFALTGQQHLIREVGLNPRHYITAEEEAELLYPSTEGAHQDKKTRPQECYSTTQQSSHQESMPAQLLKAIVHHCQNCKRCLMRRNLYDLGDKDAIRVIDTAKCHIHVDPLHEGEGGKMTEIAEKDILVALPGEEHPHIIHLEGQPGVGKTELTHQIVYNWSLEFLKRVGESIPVKIGGDLLTTIVYIAAREIKTTVPAAIYENLRCAQEDKAIMFDHVTKGKGTTIVLEALDEIRDSKVMENVQDYVKERYMSRDGPQVLLSARTDLCPINIKYIDRFITVTGFSLSQGFSYIRAYLEDKQDICQRVLSYAQAHQKQLHSVLTNPLRLHIFCALVSEGKLELNDLDNFSILKLFTLLEEILLKREDKEVTKHQLQNFYRLCLYGLLNGMREFPKELLDRFNIAEGCYVFFAKKDITDVFDKQVTFSFPHETIFEIFAAKYFEILSFENKKSLILSVSCKAEFRNLQKVMVEVILQQEQHQDELLLLMIRAICILQHEAPMDQEPEEVKEGRLKKMTRYLKGIPQYGELTLLKSEVKPVESIAEMLLEHHQPTPAKNTRKICYKIDRAFDWNPDFLREVKWFEGLKNGVLGHVSESLHTCHPKQRESISKKTTELLLPCKYRDKENRQHMVHAVGGSRWAEVVKREGPHPHVYGWHPGDIQEVMYKVRRTSGFTYSRRWLDVHLDTYQDTWGQPDSTAYSTHTWNQLYEEVKQWERTVCEKHGVPDCRLYLTSSTPLHGVLQSDLRDILGEVHKGTVGLHELYQIIHTYHLPVTQRGVWGYTCHLWHTTIVVAEGTDKALLTNMKDQLMSNKNPKLFKPKFVNTTGEEYNWS